ncbi:HNH endonuclease signature motif containing protein [Nocardia sp. NPDC059246]|uniref:HNH endonuclease signature motif containing protein n=1 Tax=unclassified Nocardia TaxID=2637762 RepID=UPI0036CA0703
MCTVVSCNKAEVNNRGWCWAHYTRWRRYGDPEELSYRKGRTPDERFWEYVEKKSDTECWIWVGGKLTDGYGSFRIDNRSKPAHRWLWERNNGPIPSGLVVRHKCDTPACVNPNHHELGTPADNSRDAVVRHRTASGSKNGSSKLTEVKVRQIKAEISAGDTQQVIAHRHGVTAGCVSHIATGRTWGHVQPEGWLSSR